MPRRFARENFTSGWHRRPISLSMLKVPRFYLWFSLHAGRVLFSWQKISGADPGMFDWWGPNLPDHKVAITEQSQDC